MYLLAIAIRGKMGNVNVMLATAIELQSTLSKEMKFIMATGAVLVDERVIISA